MKYNGRLVLLGRLRHGTYWSDMKICKICELTKPVSEFYRVSQGRPGYVSYCKPCWAAQTKANRWARNGGPPAPRPTPIERFMTKVEKTADCWLWLAATGKKGYGRFNVEYRRLIAHRFAYEALKGPIQDGYHLHHTCGTTSCVNPDHLEQVTASEHRQMHPTPNLKARLILEGEIDGSH